MNGWLAHYSADDVHVMPVEDLRPHLYFACWCHPEVEDEPNARPILIHNSMDRREEYEEGRLLS